MKPSSSCASPAASFIVAVRHAPVSVRGLCYGDSEVPVLMAAAEAGEEVLRTLTMRPSALWTSPLARCRELAQVVADRLQIPVHMDDRLREIGFGRWEGRSWAAIEAEDPSRFAHWMTHWPHQAAPGGETISHFQERVASWCAGLALPAVATTTLVITHGGVIRALRVLRSGQSWPDALAQPVPFLGGETFTLASSPLLANSFA